MKVLLLQDWHFLESGRRQRRCFRQAVLCKEPFSFYNANTICLFFLLFNLGFSLWSHLQRTFGRFWYEGFPPLFVSFFSLFPPSFCPWFCFFLQRSQVCLHPGKLRSLFKRHFHILILLSTNQILIYLGEVRVVKECLLRRQTPWQPFMREFWCHSSKYPINSGYRRN